MNHKSLLDEACLNALLDLKKLKIDSCNNKHSIEISTVTHDVVWSLKGPCQQDIIKYCNDLLPVKNCVGYIPCSKDYYHCLLEKKSLLSHECNNYLRHISFFIDVLEKKCKKEMIKFCGIRNSQDMIACAKLRFLDFDKECQDFLLETKDSYFCN